MTTEPPDRIYIPPSSVDDFAARCSTAELEYVRLPPGHVIVPVEPTQGMLDEVTAVDQHEPFSDKTMMLVYKAMIIAAAQKPEKS